MKTAREVAMERAELLEAIPAMTDPLGKYWKQPDRKLITVDATHALMSAATLDQLLDYTQSQPTGCYPGKMWRTQGWKREGGRVVWALDEAGAFIWYLHWFGIHPTDPEKLCTNNWRRVLLV